MEGRSLARLSAALLACAVACAGPGLAQNSAGGPPAPPHPLTPAEGKAIEQALRAQAPGPIPPEVAAAPGELESADPAARAHAEEVLSGAAIAIAKAAHGAIAKPEEINPDWGLRSPYDAAADFDAAREKGEVVAWLQGLRRRDPAYVSLVAAWRRYEATRAAGGWPSLPAAVALKPGARGPEIIQLRARLAAEGYGAAGSSPAFDKDLAKALAEFQRRHELAPSGVLNAATVKALNVPVEDRLATLAANLERARWLPDPMPADRIEANIPAAEVVLFRADEPALTMRAIVGDAKHHTPIFASHVSGIVFNPPWVVPTSIAKAEIWPKAHRSPGYLARNDFEVVNGQLVQRAGPKASLGFVKFDMPDPYSVYLHDTPARALFALDARGRSHGCVRLEKPRDLAVDLLSKQGWDREKVDQTIADKETKRVRPEPVPVFILYRTAEAPDGGGAIFRPDVYGWDSRLVTALARK